MDGAPDALGGHRACSRSRGLEFENRHGTVSDNDEDTADGSSSASDESLGLPNDAGVDEHLELNDPTIENPSDDMSYNDPSLLAPLGVPSSHHDISPATPPVAVDPALVPGVDRDTPTILGVDHDRDFLNPTRDPIGQPTGHKPF